MYVLYSWVVLSALPCGMYLVAYIFESRKPSLNIFDGEHVPVWKMQSKAFMPGDFGLALAIAVAPLTKPTWASWSIAAVVCFAAYYVLRNVTYNPNDYTSTQWNSPSKRYHDFIICWIFAFSAVTWWYPVFTGEQSVSWGWIVVAIGGLSVWIAGLVWDELHDEVPNRWQHPEDYWPIWRKQTPTPFG